MADFTFDSVKQRGIDFMARSLAVASITFSVTPSTVLLGKQELKCERTHKDVNGIKNNGGGTSMLFLLNLMKTNMTICKRNTQTTAVNRFQGNLAKCSVPA